jgi:hypothetical protein
VRAPPGSSSRSSACSWFTQRVRCWVRLRRRSSSIFNTLATPSAMTGFASPCAAATLAAAAALRTSVLRFPPRDNSRTRAVAVAGTSTTASPRASNHWAKCRPRPSAFSIAHRRPPGCSHTRLAQASSRRYSTTVASIRTRSTRSCVCVSRAAAVWLDLCGSMPITITLRRCPFLAAVEVRDRGRHSDFQLPGSDHTSVESGHGRRRAGPQTPGEPAPRSERQEPHE